jgi:hypothetical protein
VVCSTSLNINLLRNWLCILADYQQILQIDNLQELDLVPSILLTAYCLVLGKCDDRGTALTIFTSDYLYNVCPQN